MKKKLKTIEDQGKKQVHVLENLKPKEGTKPTEDKSNYKSQIAIIFDNLINKRKDLIKKLYDGVDYNNLKFEHVGPTKDVSLYEYRNSKELFSAKKNNQIKFSEVKNKQNEFLNKLNNMKIDKKKLSNKKKRLITFKNFTFLDKKLLFF